MTRTVEIIIGVVSAMMFVGSLAGIVWLVRQLPEHYFVKPPPKHPLPVKIVRNMLGSTLILAGTAMLVLPGQGLLTILIGLSVLDVPLKHRLMAKLLRRPKLLDAVQEIRRKAGKPPLLVPHDDRHGGATPPS